MQDTTIIIPVYNTEGTLLCACLTSALQQKTDYPFSVLVVNDGSTAEDTLGVLADFADRITLITTENQGVSAARNTALEQVETQYIMFLDADDYLEPDCLQNAVTWMGEQNADYVLLGHSRNDAYEGSTLSEVWTGTEILTLQKDVIAFRTDSYTERGLVVDAVWSKLFRTDYIQDNYITFDTNLSRSEDALFCAAYLEYCSRIYCNNQTEYHYREVGDSLSSGFSKKCVTGLTDVLEANRNFLEERGKEADFRVDNAYRAFRGLEEAEQRYFFHPENPVGLLKRYREFHQLLSEKAIREALHQLSLSDVSGTVRTIKLALWKHRLVVLYFLLKQV